MKKQYITPTVEIHQLTSQELLSSTSGVQSSKGIGYGGVDVNGQRTANSRRMAWDDFDDFEDYE